MPFNISTKDLKSTLPVIMGGGRGTRLQPLTATRSKPAVPIAGKYRLVDIPISNCINSNIRRIYVLTQFNTESLHRHITEAYHFDHFSRDFVRILAAQQTFAGDVWYQGTADAVRQNINYLLERPYQYYVILSGDQLYSMDFRQMLKAHLDCKADVTIATTPVTRDKAEGFGIMKTDASGQITNFVEKPKDPCLLENLKLTPAQLRESGFDAKDERYQASMGIYIFSRKALEDCLLGNSMMDFGREIIPAAIRGSKVQSYLFKGYWEDIGTIRSFHQANLELTDLVPNYNFFDLENPIYTRARFLPASKINSATIERCLISDGCIIDKSHLKRSIIGVRSLIEEGCQISDSVIMGADYFNQAAGFGLPNASAEIRIGRGARIHQAIIDKNAIIGENVVIDPNGRPDGENEYCYFRDGIAVVPKGMTIPDGTVV